MRVSGKVLVAGLVFTLCAAAAATAFAAGEKPEGTTKGDDTSRGVLLRGGYFGVPDSIADELFAQHPDVEGSSYGAEIRYHGSGGGRGIASIGLAIDSATATADGTWQQNDSDTPVQARGEISLLAITLTGYWNLFPSSFVHPYVGLGIGVAYTQGLYKEDAGTPVEINEWLPVLHIPVGLAVELGKYVQLAAEARFIGGIAAGGALQVRF